MSKCKGCGTALPAQGLGRKRKWCSERCRKRTLYSGVCVDCGGRTDGVASGRLREAKRCQSCARSHQHDTRYWTRDRIVARLSAYIDASGGVPPGSMAFVKVASDHGGVPLPVIQREFGSWKAGIEACGVEAPNPGCYGREGEDMGVCQDIRRRYEAGESSIALARAYDCTPPTIVYRLRKAGGRMRSAAEAQAIRAA